jgi:hypothetical protein
MTTTKTKTKLTAEQAEALIATITTNLALPVIRAGKGSLFENTGSIVLRVSLDPRETWVNGIFENSRFAIFTISADTIEHLAGYGVARFRKAKHKGSADAVAKLQKWAQASAALAA